MNKIKSFINKIKNIDYKDLFFKLLEFVKFNRQFLIFVIFTLLSCICVRIITVNDGFNFKATFFDLAVIILIGSLGFFFKPKKQYKYWKWIMIIITVLNIVNGVYYAFFQSFISFALLQSIGQTTEVTSAVFEKLRWYNFIFLIFPIAYSLYHRHLVKRDYFNYVNKHEDSKKLLVGIAILGGIFLSLNITSLKPQDISRFSKQWNREYIVERFGIIVYQGNDLVQTVRSSLTSVFGYEEAAAEFNTYFTEHENKPVNNKYTDKFKDYNVITIHLESMMSFLIDLKINGQEITPNLNKLVKESMYFDNFYSQVSVGTSSDAEFTFNSSLMPVMSGTVNVSYYNRNYETLEKLLARKGYYTFSMHGNKASMWNRNKMHPSLGFMKFYSQTDYDMDEIVGLGLSDHSFFIQSEEKILDVDNMVKESSEYKHWMGNIIMLSNHTPFDDPKYLDPENGEEILDLKYYTGKKDEKGNEIVYDYLDSKDLDLFGRYIRSAHYADKCLGEYLEYVKSHDEYNKTLFVMYGDHAAQIAKKQFGRYINFDFETGKQKEEDDPTYVNYDYYAHELYKKVPLIIWTNNQDIKGTVSYPMGMIDVMPTIGNMLGINNRFALGHDIFNEKNNNIVVFPNGNFLTKDVYYYNSKGDYRIINTDGTVTLGDEYINDRKKYTEEILKLSNDIIVYDLIEKEGSKFGDVNGN